jgi:glycogen operon protein
VNFITAHDGFTLHDLVSYNDKHNADNGEDNRDGSSNNHSWNCGAEGPTNDATIRALRERQKRNMLATLLLSQGTPMLLGGDEFGRTQRGNNNAYCQDNEISWVNWEHSENDKALIQFVRHLTQLRAHYPVLRRSNFLTAAWNEELQVKDSTWLTPTGDEMGPQHWQDGNARCVGLVLDGRAQTTGIKRRGSDATLLVIVNAHYEAISFKLVEVNGGRDWERLLDTNVPEADIEEEDRSRFGFNELYTVTGRSFLLFRLRPARIKSLK